MASKLNRTVHMNEGFRNANKRTDKRHRGQAFRADTDLRRKREQIQAAAAAL